MVGGKELAKLSLQKQALVLESSLNRLKLRSEILNLRTSSAQLTNAGRKRAPLFLALAPVAGFFLGRGGGARSGGTSWLGRIMSVVKLIGPAMALWRTFSAGRGKGESGGHEKP